MQIDGVQVALLFYGGGVLPAAATTFLLSKLRLLGNVGDVPQTQSFQLLHEDRILDCRLRFNKQYGHKIEVYDTTCTDYSGFLLWRKLLNGEMTYWASFLDGTKEQIKPIDEQTGDEILAGWEVPPLLQSPNPPIASSLYSGQMREVVQCYYLTRDSNPFQYDHYTTHGIFENPKRDLTETKLGDYYIIEVSPNGVFAAPVENTGRCCDSWDVNTYLAGEDEPAQYRSLLSLSWNYDGRDPERRGLVHRLITKEDIKKFFDAGAPFAPSYGWAFSRSGHEAQQVVSREVFSGFDFGSATENFYFCSRAKLSFSMNDAGTPKAVFAWVEKDLKCTFHRPNGILWVPEFGIIGKYNGVYPHANLVDSVAPVYVFYNGDTECVLRFQKNQQTFSNTDNGVPQSDFIGPGTLVVGGSFTVCPLCYAIYTHTYFIPQTYKFVGGHTVTTFGFTLTGPNVVNGVGNAKTGHLDRTITNSMAAYRREEAIGNNSIGNDDPLCYCGLCSNIVTNFYASDYSKLYWVRTDLHYTSISHGSCAVIPHYEREGVLLFQTDGRGELLINSVPSAAQIRVHDHTHFLGFPFGTPATPCNNETFDHDTVQFAGGIPGFNEVTTSVTYPPQGAFSGYAAIRSTLAFSTLPTSPTGSPDGPYEDVMTWIKGSKESVYLPTYIVGGGLFYPRTEEDDGIEDPLPEKRFVGYALEIEKGPFDFDGQLLTFVGRI